MCTMRVAVLVVCLLTLSITSVTQAAATPPTVYLALGDSLAVGVGATDPTQFGYVPRLFRSVQGLTDVD